MEIGKLAMECHNIGAHIGLFILTRALKWIFNYFIIIFKKKNVQNVHIGKYIQFCTSIK